MTYSHIAIAPKAAKLEDVLNPNSEYNRKVWEQAALAEAAPDLLHALIALLEDQRDASLPVLAQARAAVAKALQK